jgi:hypothetical protein
MNAGVQEDPPLVVEVKYAIVVSPVFINELL